MKVEVAPRATLLELAAQTVDIPANEAREVAWNVVAPAQLGQTRQGGHPVGDRGERDLSSAARATR
jgi:hypothetical protein